ncbi:hypothetical protein [Coxiella-like endosymbiont]|uniref:hypothetical protein n=1 Tax=Coxiella-like endosymbiont TaxID=1592897 RepID=UPI0027297AED|nr:hypothetical protein [Coxiella-like endosymbiont]
MLYRLICVVGKIHAKKFHKTPCRFVVATAIITIIVSALAFGLTEKSTPPKSANIDTTNQLQIVAFEDLKLRRS